MLSEGLGFNDDNYTKTTLTKKQQMTSQVAHLLLLGCLSHKMTFRYTTEKNSQGNYKLVIEDNANGQGDMLNSWSVNLCRALSKTETSFNKNTLDIYNISKNVFEIKLKISKESKYELLV